jgi:ubiquitin carboxyl-terminal hydrolase 5/13
VQVEDPLLGEHLARFGIDVMSLRKTDKSMAELQLDMNNRLELDSLTEAGTVLVPATGAGLIGLRNLGNSCYMNSCLQVLATMPEFRRRYLQHYADIVASVKATGAVDNVAVQLAKLAHALGTDRYVSPAAASTEGLPPKPADGAPAEEAAAYKEAMEKRASLTAVAPRMLRALVGRGHAEFSSTKQQDAQEYWEHLIDTIDRADRKDQSQGKPGSDVFAALGGRLAGLFEFEEETRLQCTVSGTVRYNTGTAATMTLPIPEELATNAAEVEAAKAEAEAADAKASGSKSARTGGAGEAASAGSAASKPDIPALKVPFEACLSQWSAESIIPDLTSGATGKKGPHTRRARFAKFPAYLLLQMRRYTVGSDWQPVKVTAEVVVPETLDLTGLRAPGGLQPDETAMPELADAPGASASAAEEASPEIVSQLMMFGIGGENACKRAALAVSNANAEMAAAWLMDHMGDADINDPVGAPAAASSSSSSSAGGSEPPEAAVAMLVEMGFETRHAKLALSETENDIGRASEWLFARAGTLDEVVAQMAAESASAAAPAATWAGHDGEGRYELFAIISHLGKNTGGGHYVAHVKKNGVWCIFNDRKVAVSQKPPFGLGYMYFFRRADAPGSIDDEPGRPVAKGADHPINAGSAASSSSSSSSSPAGAAAASSSTA